MNSENSTNSLYNYLVGGATGGATVKPTDIPQTAEYLHNQTADLKTILDTIKDLNNESTVNQDILQGVIISILDDKFNDDSDTSYYDTIVAIFKVGDYTWNPDKANLKSESFQKAITTIHAKMTGGGNHGNLSTNPDDYLATSITGGTDITTYNSVKKIVALINAIAVKITIPSENDLRTYYLLASEYFKEKHSRMAGGSMFPSIPSLISQANPDMNQSDIIRLFSPPLLLGLSQPSYVQHTDSKGNLKPPQLNYDWVPRGSTYPGLPHPGTTLPNGSLFPNVDIFLGLTLGGPVGSFGNWRGYPILSDLTHNGGSNETNKQSGGTIMPPSILSSMFSNFGRPGGDKQRKEINTELQKVPVYAHLIIRCLLVDSNTERTTVSCPKNAKKELHRYKMDAIFKKFKPQKKPDICYYFY